METISYRNKRKRQEELIMKSSTVQETCRVPRSVQLARALLVVVAISHLVIPVVMIVDRSALGDQITRQHPEFSAGIVTKAVDIALTSAVVFHGLVLILCIFLIWKLTSARSWIRRLTTLSQLLAVVFSVVSWSSSTMFHPVVLVLDAIQLVVVILLWTRPSQAFFAKPDPATAAVKPHSFRQGDQ